MSERRTHMIGFSSNHEESNFSSQRYFNFNSCGLLHPTATIESRRSPRYDNMMIYLTQGTTAVYLDGKRRMAQAGDLIFIKAGKRLDFDFHVDSEHYWMHFSGYDVDAVLVDGGIRDSGIYRIGHCAEVGDLFFQIVCALTFPNASHHALCMSYFCRILGFCAEATMPRDVNELSDGLMAKLSPAIKHMNSYYNERQTLQFYADLCHLSLSQFKHAFSQMTRIPPATYLNTIRIEAAKNLLTQSDKDIREISAMVGFEDPFYFSRLFKKHCGISPREYIKENRVAEE